MRPGSVRPVPDVLEAIRSADLITVGPGSLYTSLIPNLLVHGIVHAMRRSPAVKVYVGNLMTQPGETDGLSLAEHIEAINRHARGRVFDMTVLNSTPISPSALRRYRAQGAEPVLSDVDRVRAMGMRVFEADLLARGSTVRHDPLQLAGALRLAYRQYRSSLSRNR